MKRQISDSEKSPDLRKTKKITTNNLLTDEYPANLNYEYIADDIILIINAYLIKKNCKFQNITSGSKNTTLINPHGLTICESALPCFVLKDDKPLSHNDYQLVLCGESQSFDFSKTALNQVILKAIAKQESYVCVFPFHLGFSSEKQGGHWNIAALYINAEKKQAELCNVEPLGALQEIKNDSSIIEGVFYCSLKAALKNFNLTQITIHTAQQNDAKLCGAVAAENASFFWGVNDAWKTQYTSRELRLSLRRKHINFSQPGYFAKRQFENWIFQGYKNDDYEKADGDSVWHILRKLQLENPDEYAADFAELLKTINNWALIEPVEIKKCLADFFKKHSKTFANVKTREEEPIVLKFFKNQNCEEVIAEYNVIEFIKCLAKKFEAQLIQKPISNSIEKLAQTYKRNQGYSNTYRGDEYQKLVGMHFALDLYFQGIKQFKVLTESAEKEYDFGKFDDLIIETEKQFEVVQVKHAGSMEESKQIYTVDMLSATQNSKEIDIKKKTALHSYYDSWRNCKDKKKPIVFRFYTNHRLDDNLKKFYDEKTQCVFRPKSNTDSGECRTLIPVEGEHQFRFSPNTNFGVSEHRFRF